MERRTQQRRAIRKCRQHEFAIGEALRAGQLHCRCKWSGRNRRVPRSGSFERHKLRVVAARVKFRPGIVEYLHWLPEYRQMLSLTGDSHDDAGPGSADGAKRTQCGVVSDRAGLGTTLIADDYQAHH